MCIFNELPVLPDKLDIHRLFGKLLQEKTWQVGLDTVYIILCFLGMIFYLV